MGLTNKIETEYIGYSIDKEGNIYGKRGRKLSAVLSHSGYRTNTIYVNGKIKGVRINRLIAKTLIPNPENKPFVNHKDGNKLNNHVDNLEWCTHKENEEHALRMGLKAYGERHGMCKMKAVDAIEIKKMLAKGMQPAEIGRVINMPMYRIRDIKRGKTWKHIKT